MLYDKRWEKPEVKANPLTIESLIAWLETKPASGCYDFNNCQGKCLYGLYMASHNISWSESGACSSRDSGPEREKFCELIYDRVACDRPWTFGAALERARSAVPSAYRKYDPK